MKSKYEHNSFEERADANRWIHSVENEKGWIRDNDIYPAIQAWSSNLKDSTVLEIGCGQGICSTKISYDSYIGIDPATFLIQRATDLYKNDKTQFFVQSAYDINFHDDSFDAAFSVGVWFHLKDIRRASEELSRILRDSGKFLIITGTKETFDSWKKFYTTITIIENKVTGVFSNGVTSITEDTFYLHTNEAIANALNTNNLTITSIKDIGRNEYGENLFTIFEGYKNNSREG